MLTTIIMLLLLATSLGLFGLGMYRRLALLGACAKPDNRGHGLMKRIDGLLVYGIGQRGLFKEPVHGLMHALIFWSLLILTIRSVALIGAAFTADLYWSPLLFSRPLHHAYTLVKDITALLVLTMVLVAAYRRLVVRPERLQPSRDAAVFLPLLALLMLTDFLMHGARYLSQDRLIAHEALWSPMGRMFAELFMALGVTGSTPQTLFVVFYWLHIVLLLGFVAWLPYARSLHIVSALPNIFLRQLRPGFAPSPVADLESKLSQAAPGVGAARVEELSWKQALDMLTCTDCGRCTANCPSTAAGEPLAPGKFLAAMRDHLHREGPRVLAARSAGTPSDGAQALTTAATGENLVTVTGVESIWACTTCRACESSCPVLIEFVDKMLDLRRNLVMVEESFPPELGPLFDNLERTGNPWGRGREERTAWAADLDVPIMAELSPEERDRIELLFFVGCQVSFDARAQRIARAMVKILKAAEVSFAILGDEEGCTGDAARRLGNEALFARLAARNIALFDRYGATQILTICPHCFQTLANEYPDFGGCYEVVHHSVFIDELFADERLSSSAKSKRRVVFHDPCYLGRYNEIYEAPRATLESLRGTRLVEAKSNRENSLCCGAGGGRMWLDEPAGDGIIRACVDQLLDTKADCIAAACPFCLPRVEDEVAGRTRTADVAELVAEALELPPAAK